MDNKTDDLDSMSGVDNYKGNRLMLNTVSLNGDAEIIEVEPGKFAPKGGYFRKTLTAEQKKGEKPEEIKLGDSAKVVMLKIRRSLSERSGDKVVRWTTEHNTPDDTVELHSDGVKAIEIATARQLREKYPNLRTIQIVYGLLLEEGKEPEPVRIRIKGSALGSESKEEGVPTFYQYVSSFDKNEKGVKEHLREYVTVLSAVKEQGKKTYFTINFTRGEKLDAKLQDVANNTLRDIHGKLLAQDTARKERIASMGKEEQVADDPEKPEAEKPADYPEEEINPDDIPF